ncbi:MAG: hypothetical protein HC907_34255, partial [Richelia sp. SM1_7_0]|nr:hypothetical protein [Richelia sp. SM1_7_0]
MLLPIIEDLSDKLGGEVSNNQVKEASKLDILNYFIQTGILPWWSEQLSKQELEECCDRIIKNYPNQIKSIIEQSFKDAKQLQRIIYQFSDATLLKIAALFNVDVVQLIADYYTNITPIFKQIEPTRNITEAKLR